MGGLGVGVGIELEMQVVVLVAVVGVVVVIAMMESALLAKHAAGSLPMVPWAQVYAATVRPGTRIGPCIGEWHLRRPGRLDNLNIMLVKSTIEDIATI